MCPEGLLRRRPCAEALCSQPACPGSGHTAEGTLFPTFKLACKSVLPSFAYSRFILKCHIYDF